VLFIDAGFIADAPGPVCRVLAVCEQSDSPINVTDIETRESDHILYAGVWFPFASGSLDEVRALLEAAGIDRPGSINLRQLLELRRLSQGNPNIQVRSELPGESSLSVPEGTIAIDATLYPYQERGVGWLRALARENLGGILADEMGLGKTL